MGFDTSACLIYGAAIDDLTWPKIVYEDPEEDPEDYTLPIEVKGFAYPVQSFSYGHDFFGRFFILKMYELQTTRSVDEPKIVEPPSDEQLLAFQKFLQETNEKYNVSLKYTIQLVASGG